MIGLIDRRSMWLFTCHRCVCVQWYTPVSCTSLWCGGGGARPAGRRESITAGLTVGLTRDIKASLWFCVAAISNKALLKNERPFYLPLWRAELLGQPWAQEERSKLEVNPCLAARDVSRPCDSCLSSGAFVHSHHRLRRQMQLRPSQGLILGIIPPNVSSTVIWKGQVFAIITGQYYYGVLFAFMQANGSELTSAQLKSKCREMFCVCSDSGTVSQFNAWLKIKKVFSSFSGLSLLEISTGAWKMINRLYRS